jgi:hypothetical protein
MLLLCQPVGQSLHEEMEFLPSSVEYRPPEQPAHELDSVIPGTFEYFPGAQLIQAEVLSAPIYSIGDLLMF